MSHAQWAVGKAQLYVCQLSQQQLRERVVADYRKEKEDEKRRTTHPAAAAVNQAAAVNHAKAVNHSKAVNRSKAVDADNIVTMPVDRSTWTVAQLKRELSARGARVSGRKGELIQRLEDYDKNDDFRGPSIPVPESSPMPAWPQNALFKSITDRDRDVLPPLPKDAVEKYVKYRQTTDRLANSDSSAMKQGLKLFDCAVAALSLYMSDTDKLYMSGIVSASMKKRVQYNVKLILHKNSGEIQQSDCECPAGKGPHATCKHIVAAFLVISHFKECGILHVTKSCTETLQSFKQPRKLHTGSPMKAENMDFAKKRKTGLPSTASTSTAAASTAPPGGATQAAATSNSDDDDPRPLQFRNRPGYQDDVRNTTVNFCYFSDMDITWRYSFGKANLQTAATDHDYLQQPFTCY